MTNAPTLPAIELPHHPEYSRDRKELLNVISKVHSKLAGENGHFSDNQQSFTMFMVTLRIIPRTKFNHTSKPIKFPWRIWKP
jgi:hypothetical protein